MAGGTWTDQNKELPGVYINTKSQGSLKVTTGEKGTVAVAEPLSWGPPGVVQTIIPGEDLRRYTGYDITSPETVFLREMMKGSDVTGGPVKILLYRPSGTGGAKASADIGELKVSALYEGIRGNDITVMVQEDPDSEGTFEVTTVVGGAVADRQTVTEAGGLTGNGWVTFSGSGPLTDTAGTPLTGGLDPQISPSDYADFLQAIEPYRFDILVYDGTDRAVIQAFASFVRRLSENVGQKCQAVMADAASCNSEWVISAGNGVKLSDGTVLTPQQATWWLGGAQAGARYNQSLTCARYPDAVEAVPRLNESEAREAVRRGELVFLDDPDLKEVWVCTDINTLTSYTPDKGEEYAKNRVMRVLNQICMDTYRQFTRYQLGKVDNDDDGRGLLKGWLVQYLKKMQDNKGIKNFGKDDVTTEPGNAVDAVLVTAAVQPVDSIEKIYMTVTVAVNTGTE